MRASGPARHQREQRGTAHGWVRAAALALGAAVLTAACAAGQDAATSKELPSLDGTTGKVGQIQLEGVALLAPSGSSYPVGSNVGMSVYIVNNGQQTDKLVNVSSPSFTNGWDVVPAPDVAPQPSGQPADTASASGAAQTVSPGTAVAFGLQNLTGDGAGSPEAIELKGLHGSALYPGMSVPVTLTFAVAGSTTLYVPVQVTSSTDNATIPAPSGSDSA